VVVSAFCGIRRNATPVEPVVTCMPNTSGDLGRARAASRPTATRTRRVVLAAVAAAAAAFPAAAGVDVHAATPAKGSIDGSAPVTWDFNAIGGPMGGTDTYDLAVHLPGPDKDFYAPERRVGTVHAAVLTVTLTWDDTSPDQAVALSATDDADAKAAAQGSDTLAASNDGSNTNVFVIQNPHNTSYTLTASNFSGNSSSAIDVHARATLQLVNLAAQPQPAAPQGAAKFDTYHIPLDLMPETTWEQQVVGGRAFGEPSVGVNPNTDAVMYQAGMYTIRTTFNDAAKPARPTFTQVNATPFTDSASEDAILYVDRATGRTVVSQLTAECSLSAVSDNDGASWTPAAKPCQTPPAVDHQTIGAGPFASPLPNPAPVYPSAMYYCSQNIAEAECAVSADGGLSYGAGVPMWTSAQCFGLHGHIKVGPDGSAYVPDKACGAPECLIVTSPAGPNCHPAFAASSNNGLSWTVHTITDGHTRLFNTGDPSIGIGAKGTMYFGYGDRDGHPKVAVCTPQGATCGASVDVGGAYHIVNTEMATVVAGDDNRAAFAFLGSTMPGDDQQNAFHGTWHLYVAMTYDGGAHWTTTDTTPDAPVQRGCIEFNATCDRTRGSSDQRNLLDFNDLTIDREGRVIAAYTDGCQPDLGPPAKHGTCLDDATRLSGLNPEIEGPAMARQSCGLTLYASRGGCGRDDPHQPERQRHGRAECRDAGSRRHAQHGCNARRVHRRAAQRDQRRCTGRRRAAAAHEAGAVTAQGRATAADGQQAQLARTA
jgi:hypothetical protein